jgi:hypothetical protein
MEGFHSASYHQFLNESIICLNSTLRMIGITILHLVRIRVVDGGSATRIFRVSVQHCTKCDVAV